MDTSPAVLAAHTSGRVTTDKHCTLINHARAAPVTLMHCFGEYVMADSENRLKPNTFQTPNLLVDKLMPLLDDRELRVLIFATRHIYGWPETNAAGRECLSVSAFEKGQRGSGGKCG